MKTNKTKAPNKASNKAIKKHIEKSLTEKFIESVVGLGHNAEVIADDIAKLSKVAAKKLTKKFREVKSAIEHKIDDVAGTSDQNAPVKKVKLAKKDASKLMKKVDKSITKVVKKAVKKAKPVGTSVTVAGPGLAQKSEMPVRTIKPKDMTAKVKSATAKSSGKAVIKAETNNPVKKVANKAIPTKKNTTSK